jgi:hypothetical protein
VIRGGVYSSQELDRALEADPVASAHYAGFDRTRVQAVRATSAQMVYASYRVRDRIYWTRRPVRLAVNEMLLSDGENLARARCGNRLSPTPQAPVGPEVGLDTPEVAGPASAGVVSIPMLTHEVFPGLLESRWFQPGDPGMGGTVAGDPPAGEPRGGGIGTVFPTGLSVASTGLWVSGPPPNAVSPPFPTPVSSAMLPVEYHPPVNHLPGPGFVNGTQFSLVAAPPPPFPGWITPPAATYLAFGPPGGVILFPTRSFSVIPGQTPLNSAQTGGSQSAIAPPAGSALVTGNSPGDPPDPAAGGTQLPSLVVVGDQVRFNNTPEPSTTFLFAGGAVLVAIRRRRRKSRPAAARVP